MPNHKFNNFYNDNYKKSRKNHLWTHHRKIAGNKTQRSQGEKNDTWLLKGQCILTADSIIENMKAGNNETLSFKW